MMDIIQRNLFRLLRNGAFGSDEKLEPMSVFKWESLYQLAVMHEVTLYAYQGLMNSRNQFFLHLTDKLWKEWQKAAEKAKNTQQDIDEEEDEFLRPDHLTNPVLNNKLQNILDDEHSDMTTRQLLLQLIRVMRHILNEGMPILQLTELGLFLRDHNNHINYITFSRWTSRLHLTDMTQLTGEFLIKIFEFTEEEIPFMKEGKEKPIERIAQELIEFTNTRAQNWYFTQQDGGIFVHNSNSSATLSHVRRSARYFRYYPSESVTNFFASFVHSLSHIEE